jgi:hypothetical protein
MFICVHLRLTDFSRSIGFGMFIHQAGREHALHGVERKQRVGHGLAAIALDRDDNAAVRIHRMHFQPGDVAEPGLHLRDVFGTRLYQDTCNMGIFVQACFH